MKFAGPKRMPLGLTPEKGDEMSDAPIPIKFAGR
jgi:hypothetical protein